uniref:Uncharacterized protein n=1 Tax=Timema monikensis TaxID=170555 RepID=A0A7R9HT47_9NEOP|nr:unnamed protein product [Timema monikensis]
MQMKSRGPCDLSVKVSRYVAVLGTEWYLAPSGRLEGRVLRDSLFSQRIVSYYPFGLYAYVLIALIGN